MRILLIHGGILALLFGGMAALAPELDVADPRSQVHPAAVVGFVAMMLAAGLAWWTACRAVRHLADSRPVILAIVFFAVGFREILVFSPPILELDVYRYLWDGFVATQGVDPFRFSPAEVIEAYRLHEPSSDARLASLAASLDSNRAALPLVHLVHYPDLPTAYPPTAQLLFAAAAVGASDASVCSRVVAMKLILATCEAATWAFVVLLLRRTGTPIRLLLIPAWCPLAVLSIANQGHLDALPALLTTAAAAIIASPGAIACLLSGGLLALAIGAKIYPLLLVPLFVLFAWRRERPSPQNGRTDDSHRPHAAKLRAVAVFFIGLVSTSILVWTPMLHHGRWDGLTAFARRWEMYDSFFAVVVGNLKPDSLDGRAPWYVFLPNNWRRSVDDPNGLARLVWLAGVALILGYFLRGHWRKPDLRGLLESCFLLFAWFWALGPVCNPWYLTWLLPFLPFASNPGWKALFVLAPAFFLRFSLGAGFGVRGEWWFDHVVALALTAVWLLAVMVGKRRPHFAASNSTGTMALSAPDRNPSRSTLT